MKLIDKNFKDNAARYILQCGLATLSVMVILAVLDAINNTTIIAALGASTFIAFTMPHKPASNPRFLIGGYLMGTLSGTVCHSLSMLSFWEQIPWVGQDPNIVFGAVAVGLAIFLMVVTDTEHPPAAGLALGFVLNTYTALTVVVVILGILSLAGIKTLLKPVLRNL